MTSAPTPSGDALRVDQAIAFGRSPDWMVEKLGVTQEFIASRHRYLDKANRHVDHDPPPRLSKHGHRLAPCGTKGARDRHRANGETCEECTPAPQDLLPCGTEASNRRHLRRGETCQVCKEAARLAESLRRQRRKKAA